MALNVPSFTANDFSFGPGRLFLGTSGTTPSVDVGGITEDGITIEPENTTKDITQGNPKQIVYTFNQAQGLIVNCTGIEWDITNLAYAMGAGNTAISASAETWAFGGDPITKKVAIHIQHQMAVSGDTMNVYVWQAVSAGPVPIGFIHDEHKFPMKFKAQRVTTNWAGAALATTEELMLLSRAL